MKKYLVALLLLTLSSCNYSYAMQINPLVKDVSYIPDSTKQNYIGYSGICENVSKDFVAYLLRDTTQQFVSVTKIEEIRPSGHTVPIFFIQWNPKENRMKIWMFDSMDYKKAESIGKSCEPDALETIQRVISVRYYAFINPKKVSR